MNNLYDEKIYEIKNYYNNESVFFISYSGKADIVCNTIKNGNIWEKDLSDFLDNNIKKTDIIIEAGTHIGTHTIKLGLLGNKVYGFEPFPQSNYLVNKNLEINNINNVILSNNALSSNNKTIYIEYHCPLSRNIGAWGLYFETEENKNNIKVECITIDSLNLDKLDFIKLDVEGFEKDVLIGGINTIKKFKPLIIFENWGENQSIDINITKNQFNFLIDIGYKITYLNGSELWPSNGSPDYIARFIE
jgi:FkbM family methyltransferase